MRVLRKTLARISISIGVLVLGLWASARFIVHMVEDGTVLTGIADAALHIPLTQQRIAAQAQYSIDSELEAEGIDPADYGLEDDLEQAVTDAVGSEGFIDALVGMIGDVEASLVAQLTDDTLPLAPLTLTLDITDPLKAAVSDNPQIAEIIPAASLEPADITLLEEDDVERIRNGYGWVEDVAAWGLWIGLGLLAAGFVLLPSKRWVFPKLFLWAGVSVLGLWALVRWINVDSIFKWLPGGSEGDAASLARDLIPQGAIDRAESPLLMGAVSLLVASAALFVLVWWIFRDKKKARPEPESITAETRDSPGGGETTGLASTAPMPAAAPPSGAPVAPPTVTPVASPMAPPAVKKGASRAVRRASQQTPAPATPAAIPVDPKTAPPAVAPTTPQPVPRVAPKAAPKAVPKAVPKATPPAIPPAIPPTAPPAAPPPIDWAASPAATEEIASAAAVPKAPPSAEVPLVPAKVPTTKPPIAPVDALLGEPFATSADTPPEDSSVANPAANPAATAAALKRPTSPLEAFGAPEDASADIPMVSEGTPPTGTPASRTIQEAPESGSVPPLETEPSFMTSPELTPTGSHHAHGRAAARRAREAAQAAAAAEAARKEAQSDETPKPQEPQPPQPPKGEQEPENPML